MSQYTKRSIDELPISTEDRSNVHLWVIVYRKGYGVLLRPWNIYHACFDDEEMDDHDFDKEAAVWWCLCPHINYLDFQELL